MSRLTKVGVAIASTMLAIVASAVVADGAYAASPVCTKSVTRTVSNGIPNEIAYVPATSTNSINCYLQQGNSSDAVLVLQWALNGCYNKNLEPDGDFGSLTKAALMEVQRIVIPSDVDGVYGPNTRMAMKWGGGAAAWPCGHIV